MEKLGNWRNCINHSYFEPDSTYFAGNCWELINLSENTNTWLQTKPPQCLKLNLKDDLSILSPSQCIRLLKLSGKRVLLESYLWNFLLTVVLYLHDYAPDYTRLDSIKMWQEIYSFQVHGHQKLVLQLVIRNWPC